MKAGNLVRFKVHHYHKSYGIGIVLGTTLDNNDFKTSRHQRLRVLFNGEQVVVRFEELEVVNETR